MDTTRRDWAFAIATTAAHKPAPSSSSARSSSDPPNRPGNDRGASLVEAMLAALLLAIALSAMAQLMVMAGATNLAARSQTVATILAAQKLEQLRLVPGATGLAPGGSLDQNLSGYVDHLDSNGAVVSTGSDRPAGAVYTRRWSIAQASSSPEQTWVLQVRVILRGTIGQLSTVRRSSDE